MPGIGNDYFVEIDPTGSIGAAVQIFKIQVITGPDVKLLGFFCGFFFFLLPQNLALLSASKHSA